MRIQDFKDAVKHGWNPLQPPSEVKPDTLSFERFFSARTANTLISHGFTHPDELWLYNLDELSSFSGVGKVTRNELRQFFRLTIDPFNNIRKEDIWKSSNLNIKTS